MSYQTNSRAIAAAAADLGVPQELVSRAVKAYMNQLHGNPCSSYFPFKVEALEDDHREQIG